jgi:arylsulfatase A-like enzyme
VSLVAVDLAQAALSWTGAGDAVSLYKEANWLDDSGAVPSDGSINGNTALSADTGGLIEISSGSGTPGNFNGDFMLASGDDLLVANGKELGGNDNLVGGGAGSVMTISGAGSWLNAHAVTAFDSIVVEDGGLIELADGSGITMYDAGSPFQIAGGSSAEFEFILNAVVTVDGTSSLTLSGTGIPINTSEIHLDIGAQLSLHSLAEFAEQGAKIFVDGVSFADDPTQLSFSGSGPVTATATSNGVPYIATFSASPEAFSLPNDVELSWQTASAGYLEISDGSGVVTSFVASVDGQAVLDSSSIVVGSVSTSTTYTLSVTDAEDGSGGVNTMETVVTVTVPGPGTDSDLDGLPDLDEASLYSTNPNKRDSDGDGTPDGLEIERGLDPNDPDEYLERPNILFFFVDDLGYGDLGCFWQDQRSGTQKFDTPNIDSIAAGGAKLTHHYVAAAVCAPTRSSLLQGRHQGHATVRDNNFDKAIADNHTIADMLRRAGYRTVHVGKNGVAGGEGSVSLTGTGSQDLEAHPLKRGFDEFFGYLFHADGHEHFPQNGGTSKTAHIYNGYQQTTDASLDLYTTDAWTAYAKKAITEEVQDGDHQPFFLYLAYDTPHFKMQRPAVAYPAGGGLSGGIQWTTATDASGNTRYASTADGTGTEDAYNHPDNDSSWPTSNQQHVGMIRRIDNSMADIMQLLADLGVDDNTLVIFSSDNGPHNEGNDPRYFGSFADMEGTKRDLLEAGIRVPTIVNWPGMIDGATDDEDNIHEIDYPCAIWDWMPTFAELAQVPQPAWCDGVSILPTLTGEGEQRNKGYLYFEYYHNSATSSWGTYFPNHAGERRDQMQCVRIGDYMGIRTDIEDNGYDFRIYNVVTDPGQGTDLAASLPELHRQMKDIALQGRRSESSAARPYDDENVPNASRSVMPGLDYSCHEGIWSFVPEFRDLPAVVSGSISNLDLSVRSRDDHVGILFSGYIEIPAAGSYTFHLTSDSGANLFIHDAHVIDDDFNHEGTEQSASVNLTAGLHPIRLYYRHGRASAHALGLDWEGPGIARQAVPDESFYRLPEINVAMARENAGGLIFTWNSTTGQTYRVLGSDSLSIPRSAWSNVLELIPTTAPTNTLSIELPTDNQKFYVVEEE